MNAVNDVPTFAQRARKAIAGFVVPVLTVIALVAPDLSDEASAVVGLVGAVLSGVAVYKVKNDLSPEDLRDQYYSD